MVCRECGKALEKNRMSCPQCGMTADTSHTIFDKVAKFEEILIAVFLGTMIVLVLAQIVLRNFFHTGIIGGDSIVRHCLLLVVFLGAGLVTREGSHIRIDIASKMLPEKWKQYIEIVIDIFSAIVCGVLVYASCSFVSFEYEGQQKLPFSQIPVWVFVMILPAGYLVIALRFASKGAKNILALMQRKAK